MVPLVAAEGKPRTQELSQLLEKAAGALLLPLFSRRHDVAPEEASGVLHGLSGGESVGRVEVLQAIIVEVDEPTASGRSRHEGPCFGAPVPELPVPEVFVKAVPSSQLLEKELVGALTREEPVENPVPRRGGHVGHV